MRISRIWAIALVFALLSCQSGQKEKKVVADMVLTNGKIYTVDEEHPWAEAMAVKDGEIIAIGDGSSVEGYLGDGTQMVDLNGKFLMPGIVSTHEHSIFLMAVNSGLVIKELSHDKDKMLAELKKYLEENPNGPYMSYGGGYENTVKIHRKEIDAITGPDIPFFMMSATGHAGWANTKMLELAGVTKDTEPIDFFGRDPDGTRNGYVGTAAAAYYMMGVAGLKKEAVMKSAPKILNHIASMGVTHMWEVGQPPGHEEPLFDAIGELERSGDLTTRYSVAMMVQREKHIPWAIEGLQKFNEEYHSDMFKVNSLKIHGDGSFEGHTSFLLEPYSDKPDEYGILSVPEDKSIEAALEVAKLGFDMHTHAIGDAANRSFLNVFQRVRDAGYNDVRLTMGHTQLVSDEDLQRFKDLDVSANYFTAEVAQPNPGYIQKLGQDRYAQLLRLGTMEKMGIRVALSADYPSTTLNPFVQIHAAVTRSYVGSDEILGSANEKLTLEQAIKDYTLNAAYTVRAEGYSGSLEVGKKADFIILDRNPFEIPEDDILNIKVLNTYLEGRLVFDREKEKSDLQVQMVEVTNPNLQSAIDIQNLNLLVDEEVLPTFCEDEKLHKSDYKPGSKFAPELVNQAFESLPEMGYQIIKPARAVYWEKDNAYYWIQWTKKDHVSILWAYDPESDKAVEVLRVNGN